MRYNPLSGTQINHRAPQLLIFGHSLPRPFVCLFLPTTAAFLRPRDGGFTVPDGERRSFELRKWLSLLPFLFSPSSQKEKTYIMPYRSSPR